VLFRAVALAPDVGYSFGMPPPVVALSVVLTSDIYNGRKVPLSKFLSTPRAPTGPTSLTLQHLASPTTLSIISSAPTETKKMRTKLMRGLEIVNLRYE